MTETRWTRASEAAKEAARVRNRRWRERHREEDVARSAARHAANREEYNARARAWHAEHRDEANARMRENYRMREQTDGWRVVVHGITRQEHDALYADQDGRCAICGDAHPKTGLGLLVIDHDHDTGERRGLLCRRCNLALPAFEELGATWMLRALAYLGDPPLRRLRKDRAS
jgi:hypothetical protein